MCLRQYDDLISHEIRVHGVWDDCFPLIHMWKNTLKSSANEYSKIDSFFVDVGANIGSCSLMMAAAGVKVIAFEPSPSNLFYFSQSILANVRGGDI